MCPTEARAQSDLNGDSMRHLSMEKSKDNWRKIIEKTINGESIMEKIIIEKHKYIRGTYLSRTSQGQKRLRCSIYQELGMSTPS